MKVFCEGSSNANTNISDVEWQTNSLFKNDTVVVREASTDIFNEASLVTSLLP